jgi:CO/xanthine dehydrogenase FAD-binding subunit
MSAVLVARSLRDAIVPLSDDEAVALAGGTDLMVDVNAGRIRPRRLVSLARVAELAGYRDEGDGLVLGANTTYRELIELGHRRTEDPRARLLAEMASGVGSPASRNVGTLGGALGTARGNGDALTALVALDAVLLVAGVAGTRSMPATAWPSGRRRGEVIVEIHLAPMPAGSVAHYTKVTPRHAMSTAIVNCALTVSSTQVRCSVGGVGPRPVRATGAERLAAEAVPLTGRRTADLAYRFGAAVADEIDPPGTWRAPAEYRRHAVAVLAARSLRACLTESARTWAHLA